ncbi:uncharacterized protein LOC129590127 isoform X2 [Paramacrobiotus metropolitanus]|nr:uncharacterized protein LOC129590127 isoform X2 [Paramacrobiotus metropolitanus]
MAVRLLRRSPQETEGQVVARFDDSTGNCLLSSDVDPCSVINQIEGQSLELRTCVEGFCFRPRLKFQSFVNIREIAEKPIEGVSAFEGTEPSAGRANYELPAGKDDIPNYEAVLQQMDSCAKELQAQHITGKGAAGNTYLYGEGTTSQTKPPFVVRHIDDKLFNRIPKLHKTMSQETDQMLAHYQLDHPSDTAIQKIQPGNVPVKVYWKLRRDYEKSHFGRTSNKQPGIQANIKQIKMPALNSIRESPERTNRQNMNKETVAALRSSLTNGRKEGDNQFDQKSTETSEPVSLDGRPHTLAEVKQFIKQTGNKYEPDKADHEPGCPASHKPKREVTGAGDDVDMAAVYRDFAKTLHRDRMEKICQELQPEKRERVCSPCSTKSAEISWQSPHERTGRRSKTTGNTFTMERDMLCSNKDYLY